MNDIKDPSFISPLFVAYERFKDTQFSHYFLSSLLGYSSPQVKLKLKEIATDLTPKYLI